MTFISLATNMSINYLDVNLYLFSMYFKLKFIIQYLVQYTARNVEDTPFPVARVSFALEMESRLFVCL